MGQVQVIGARLRRTVYMNGRILNPGYYEEADGRLSRKDFQDFLNYETRQQRLSPEKRDKPPIVTLDYLPIDEIKNKEEIKAKAGQAVVPPKFGPVDYESKTIAELREICKKRNIPFTKKDDVEKLAGKLAEFDKELLSWTDRFKDGNEFAALTDEEKLDYLESIFGLPEGIEENSSEAEEYSTDLMDAVRCYSGIPQSDEVVNKLKEILEYYES